MLNYGTYPNVFTSTIISSNIISHNVTSYNVRNHVVSARCPICREENEINRDTHPSLYIPTGNSIKCIICTTNEIKVFFPKCGHACLCWECFDRLYV